MVEKPRREHRRGLDPRKAGRRAVVLLVIAASCARPPAAADPWELYEGLVRSRRIEVVLATPRESEVWREVAGQIQTGARALEAQASIAVLVLAGEEQGDRRAARIVVAGRDAPEAQPLWSALGAQVTGDGFRFADRLCSGPDDVLIATFRDPERPQVPVTAYLGNRAVSAARLARDLAPAWRPCFQLFIAGELDLEGELELSGSPDLRTLRDYGPLRRQWSTGCREFRAGEIVLQVPASFRIEDHQGFLDAVQWAASRAARVFLSAEAAGAGAAGTEAVAPEIRMRVFTSAEDKARITGSWELSDWNAVTGTVDVLLAPNLPSDGGAGAARAAAIRAAGTAVEPWLFDGIGTDCASNYWGRNTWQWMAFLHAGGLVPKIHVLVDPAAEESPHVLAPARGMLFRYLLYARGAEHVRNLWTGRARMRQSNRLQNGFEEWMEHEFGGERDRIVAEREAQRSRVLSAGFRRGVALYCQPGLEDADERGYGTRLAREALEEARSAGADSFSLTVFAYADRGLPERPVSARVRPDASAPDLALFASAAAGRQLGMTAMLKPHSVLEPSGNWSGWRSLNTEAEWSATFREFRRTAVHYALLAELCGAEMLCLGTGAPLATFTKLREGDEAEWELRRWKLERWREVIALSRAAFTGGLTYAANWGDQVAQIEFWDELDFVGADLYDALYVTDEPWAEPERAPRDEDIVQLLRFSLSELAEAAARHGKRALITEIGFPATERAWCAPWAARGAPSATEQRRLFRCLESALAAVRANRGEPAGVYVWRWDTDVLGDGHRDRLFTPRGKLSASVIARIFHNP